MDEVKNYIINKIKDADMVLVGIGEEFSVNMFDIRNSEKYISLINKIEKKSELQWMHSYIDKICLENYKDKILDKAYVNVKNILKDKNYFIISTCYDDYIFKTGFDKNRMVTPCGGYRFLQCEENCDNYIVEELDSLTINIHNYLNSKMETDYLMAPVCEKCGKNLVFNNINAENYVEEGYMKEWNLYTKWLQGTLNKKLCILELGVGMTFPTVIRWPFEKIAFFNNKAFIFRIHNKLFHLTEELKGKGNSITENSKDFFANWFV